MDEELEKVIEGKGIFVPSHLTRALIGGGVGIVSGAISIGALKYAIGEFRKVTMEEVEAMIKPPENG